MVSFAPYINFRGTAREAMEFYRTVFGGELILNSAAGLGLDVPGSQRDRVMHAQLSTRSGMVLMGGDIHADDAHQPDVGNVCTIMISGEEADVRQTWEMLSEGGTVITPFAKAPWGDFFGSCTDKFGTPWLVNVH